MKPESAIRSCNTGPQIPYRWQLSINQTWMSIIKLNTRCRFPHEPQNVISHCLPCGAVLMTNGRTYVRSCDYQDFSDIYGHPNKPISIYWNSHLVPRLQGIKQKKCIILCWALSLFAKSESESPVIMSPFWLIFPVFLQILAFSEWKKQEIGNVKNEKYIVCSRFHLNLARQVNFSYDIHSYFRHLPTLTRTDAHGT